MNNEIIDVKTVEDFDRLTEREKQIARITHIRLRLYNDGHPIHLVFAKEIGADAIASIPPFYYSYGRKEIETYYKKIKQASNLPLFFYNIPSLINVSLELGQGSN